MPFVDIAIETANITAAVNRLHSLGLSKGDGIRVYSDNLEGVNGLFYFTFRVFEDRVHVIPGNNNPTFTIVWRGDEFDEEGKLFPWPMVDCERFDEETQQMVHWSQGIGRIA